MMLIPFPRYDTAAREAVWRDEIRAAKRRGIVDVAVIRRNIGRHAAIEAEEFQKAWAARNEPVSLRSSNWDAAYHAWRAEHNCEPLTEADKERCDAEDIASNRARRAEHRAHAREHAARFRWACWFLSKLEDPAEVAMIEDDPTVYLHWEWADWARTLPVLCTVDGRVVAWVAHEGGPGPTFRAIIYKRHCEPRYSSGSTYSNTAPHVEPRPRDDELTWQMVRQRKQGLAFILHELSKRQYGMFGGEVDIPELNL